MNHFRTGSGPPVVWLIGGPSSVGKSTIARQLALRHKMAWLQLDDLRLAIQRNETVSENPGTSAALGFFETTADVWSLPLNVLLDAFIAIGRILSPSLEIVVLNHLAIGEPIVIDGDGFLPAILDSPELQLALIDGRVRVAFVLPNSEGILRENLNARGWGEPGASKTQVEAMVAAKFEYGQWLRKESLKRGFHTVTPLPYSSLLDRIEAGTGATTT